MSKSKWAPIVYGRTYEVDFRFIVTPDDFDPQLLDWAANFIHVTTRVAENLPNNPRWLLYKGKRYCLVGVTCMVRELIGSLNAGDAKDYTKDCQGRPLYAFVGYVARKLPEANVLDFPSLPPMELKYFAQLYKYVRQRWSEKSYDVTKQGTGSTLTSAYTEDWNPTSKILEEAEAVHNPEADVVKADADVRDFKEKTAEIDISVPSPEVNVLDPLTEVKIDTLVPSTEEDVKPSVPDFEEKVARQISPEDLNYYGKEEDLVYLWSNENNQELWLAASKSHHRLSICLGLSSEKDFIDRPFLNGTASDVSIHKRIERRRILENRQVQHQPSRKTKQLTDRQSEYQQAESSHQQLDLSVKKQVSKSPLRQDFQAHNLEQSEQSEVNAQEPSTRLPKIPMPPLREMGEMIAELVETLGGIVSGRVEGRLEQRLKDTRNQIKALYVEFEKTLNNLGEAQKELVERMFREAFKRFKEADNALYWKNYSEAKEKLTDAHTLLEEISALLKQRHIDFKFKSELPEDSKEQEDDSIWTM